MSTSLANYESPPNVSGALRYERVARLEAVLLLRDKNHRSKVWGWTLAGISLLCVAAIGAAWWLAA